MRIAVYGSRRLQSRAATAGAFLDVLRERGIGVVMHSKLYDHLRDCAPAILDGVVRVDNDDDFSADLAVSIGGDGTVLRAAVWVGAKEIPLIGFNAGNLGFLTAASIDELPGLPDAIEAGLYEVERRSMLEVVEPALPHWCSPYALNEIAIGKVENSSMITVGVSIEGSFMANYRGDGLIISTATGSTAYNLSVGGPIVQPTMDVCVLSPIATHSLSMRPMVVDINATIGITTQSRASRVRMSMDSRSFDIDAGSPVTIRRAPFALRLLQPAGLTFSDRLREKLHWAES